LSNGDNKRFLKTKKETEIAYDFGKTLTVNGYVRGEKLVNSIPFYVYLINYRQMAGGEKSSTLAKGQLISKALFSFFNSSKKQTKNFCPSRLGQKLRFSSLFLEELKTPKFPFEIK
jgi:hypothetical protein